MELLSNAELENVVGGGVVSGIKKGAKFIIATVLVAGAVKFSYDVYVGVDGVLKAKGARTGLKLFKGVLSVNDWFKKKTGLGFDDGLSPYQKAVIWTVDKTVDFIKDNGIA